ncbi:MAG: rhomboid family intramembrane serine protease, partial [Myxococcota bacterium]
IQLAAGFDASPSPYLAAQLGANIPILVTAGQLDRLVTANWLHVAWFHIGINAVGVYFLGIAVERLFGSSRMLIVYLAACFAGAIASTVVALGAASMGASTGIAGLFGAFGYILLRFRRSLPEYMRRAIRSWFVWLFINIALWVVFSSVPVDHAGHAGGFAGGIVAAALVSIGWRPLVPESTLKPVFRTVAGVLVLVTLVGLGTSAYRARETQAETNLALAQGVLADASVSSGELNGYAWFPAIDHRADPALVTVAQALAARAVAKLPDDVDPADRAAVLDTLATTEYRLGNYDRAVELELQALGDDPRDEFEAQLGRFLLARSRRDGPLRRGATPDLTLGLVRDHQAEITALTIDGDRESAGFVLRALVVQGDRLLGQVVAAAGPGQPIPRQAPLQQSLAEGTEVVLAYIDSDRTIGGDSDSDPDTSRDGAFEARFVPMDMDIAGYPGPFPEFR